MFKLAVSQGRGKRIWLCNVEMQHLATGESGLYLMTENEFNKGFVNLETLSDYYRYIVGLFSSSQYHYVWTGFCLLCEECVFSTTLIP